LLLLSYQQKGLNPNPKLLKDVLKAKLLVNDVTPKGNPKKNGEKNGEMNGETNGNPNPNGDNHPVAGRTVTAAAIQAEPNAMNFLNIRKIYLLNTYFSVCKVEYFLHIKRNKSYFKRLLLLSSYKWLYYKIKLI